MKNIYATISLFFMVICQIRAQVHLGAEVWASSGNSYSSKNLIVDYTVGESIIFSGDFNNGTVSQGFQQPVVCKTIPIIISSNETSCQNAYSLSINAGFDYYQWKLEKGLIVNHKSNTYLPVENGNYSVTVGDSSGCLFNSLPIFVDLSNRSGSATISVFGNTTEDTIAIANNATNYQWYLVTNSADDPKAIVGATQKSYKPIITGEYFVKINSGDYCAAISSKFKLRTNISVDFGRFSTTDSTIDFSHLSIIDRKLTIYPNPTSGIFFIDYESPSQKTVRYELYNMLGVIVDTKELLSMNGNIHKEIQGLQFSKGTYLVKISDNEHIITKTIMIE